MADSRPNGERVFCHQCNNEWDRAHGGLICPRCESEFTEVLEPGTTSSLDIEIVPRTPSPPATPPLRPLFDHNPWNVGHNHHDLDPDPRNNFTTFEFTSNGGGGRISFSTRSFRTTGTGPNARAMPPPFGAFSPFAFPGNQQPGFGAFTERDPHAPPQAGNLQDLFSMMLQSMQPPGGPGQQMRPDEAGFRGQDHPPHPFDLLNQIFNGGTARRGDMVFSQDAFDQVMTQLMEQNGGSNAPPPASEEAIQSLEKKKIDQEMLGAEGSAECSICMEDVALNQEVTVLPCKHWFHGECVVAWLKEHDTCPHCRSPISQNDQNSNATANQRPGPWRRRASRRASSVSSPRPPPGEGWRYSSIHRPDSPSQLRESRRQYYGNPQNALLEPPEPIHHSSSHDSRGHRSGSGGGESNGASRNQAGGGMSGWLRDHLPFS